MSGRKHNEEGSVPEGTEERAFVERLRRSGAARPQDDHIIDWADKMHGTKLDADFCAKAMTAIGAGIESRGVAEARDRVLAAGPLPWKDLLPALWKELGVSVDAVAAKAGVTAEEIKRLLVQPCEVGVEVLSRVAEELELQADTVVDAIRRGLPTKSRTRRGANALGSPRLAQGSRSMGNERSPLKQLENELRKHLSEHGRHDLL